MYRSGLPQLLCYSLGIGWAYERISTRMCIYMYVHGQIGVLQSELKVVQICVEYLHAYVSTLPMFRGFSQPSMSVAMVILCFTHTVVMVTPSPTAGVVKLGVHCTTEKLVAVKIVNRSKLSQSVLKKVRSTYIPQWLTHSGSPTVATNAMSTDSMYVLCMS